MNREQDISPRWFVNEMVKWKFGSKVLTTIIHLNIIKIFITAILLTSLIFQACINHFIWPRWIVNEIAKRKFAWSILNLIIKSHGESWTRYFATVICERDGEMEVWVQSFNYYNTLKHNKNLYYSNPAYKLDFSSLH